ncbi:MAG: glucose-6-phosphate isomerase [Xanthomonadales bacterium]|nr:glucose-6-phosphate isomerase [Xanthomonadales bacterium]
MAPAPLAAHARRLRRIPLARLAGDEDRNRALRVRACGLELDLRRECLDRRALVALLSLARERGLSRGVEALFAGEALNVSEGLPALHPALRGEGPPEAARAAAEELRRMEALVEALRERPRETLGLEEVGHLVHVGIGGSLNGVRLIHEALAPARDAPLRLHFLASPDGHALARVLAALDPARTAVVIASKSFATEETLALARALLAALGARRGASEKATLAAAIAVTSHPERAVAFGIAPERILRLPPAVGGRYSACSATSFAAVATIGIAPFRELLAGAAAMDRHFREAPPEGNLPLLAALADFWQRVALRAPAFCLLPYGERLSPVLPWYRQLLMESLGKGVDREGRALAGPAGPPLLGDGGSEAEHSLLQWLAQAPERVPVDFVAALPAAGEGPAELERLRLDHLLAQAAALAAPPAELAASPCAHRRLTGNRPSRTILLERLAPAPLGALIALLEHRVFALGWLLGVNPFDQWGVEAGKRLARAIALSRCGGPVPADPLLAERLREPCG